MMLIAFEGLDQSGKETQARHLRTRLAHDGQRVRAISFPDYGTPIGQELRRALDGERDYAPDVMQLLYIANRYEYKQRLDLWLAGGDIVICDRYRASSIAYGEAQGLDPEWLDDVQRHLPAPALTLLLDIAPDTARKRKSDGRDVFERDLALLARVRSSYRRQAAQPGWMVIDGERSKDEVTAAVDAALAPALSPPSVRPHS
jgi:dTMP kinase